MADQTNSLFELNNSFPFVQSSFKVLPLFFYILWNWWGLNTNIFFFVIGIHD